MKYISLLFIMIILAACLSPSGDQSAPQVTVTLTATSIPTTTPIPTPTTHPQVMAIREQIAQSADFTLNADGQIEMQTPEGMTIVPDVQVQPDGRMTFTHNGQEFTANTETLEINGQTIRFKDTEGKTWVWDGESLKEVAEEKEVKEYQVCRIENFRDCTIPVEDLIDGSYLRWLQTLSKPFPESQIKKPFNFEYVYTAGMTPYAIVYKGDAPFRRDVTFAQVLLEVNGKVYPYVVKPIEFYDKNDPRNNKWVITVNSIYNENPIYNYPDSDIDESIDKYSVKTWKYNMYITPICIDTYGPSIYEDAIVRKVFENNPDMAERFEKFINGDVSALSGEGIILLTTNLKGR